MKALSLIEPWASAIFDLQKHYETRSWPTDYTGPLAIHTSRKVDRGFCRSMNLDPARYRLGVVIGIVHLDPVVRMTKHFIKQQTPEELMWGHWKSGRYAFPLCIMVRFEKPFPVRGSLGLWNWTLPAGLEQFNASRESG